MVQKCLCLELVTPGTVAGAEYWGLSDHLDLIVVLCYVVFCFVLIKSLMVTQASLELTMYPMLASFQQSFYFGLINCKLLYLNLTLRTRRCTL